MTFIAISNVRRPCVDNLSSYYSTLITLSLDSRDFITLSAPFIYNFIVFFYGSFTIIDIRLR